MDATRADPEFLAEVVRAALSAGRHHHQHPRHRGLHAARRAGGAILKRLRETSRELEDAMHLVSRPGRSRPLHGQRHGGGAGRREAGGAGGQRHRRARGQYARSKKWSWRCACTAQLWASARASTPRHLRALQAGRGAERARGADEQGHRRAQRVPPRLGDSSRRRHRSGARPTRSSTPHGWATRSAPRFVLGKLSGRAGFRSRARELGFDSGIARVRKGFREISGAC